MPKYDIDYRKDRLVHRDFIAKMVGFVAAVILAGGLAAAAWLADSFTTAASIGATVVLSAVIIVLFVIMFLVDWDA